MDRHQYRTWRQQPSPRLFPQQHCSAATAAYDMLTVLQSGHVKSKAAYHLTCKVNRLCPRSVSWRLVSLTFLAAAEQYKHNNTESSTRNAVDNVPCRWPLHPVLSVGAGVGSARTVRVTQGACGRGGVSRRASLCQPHARTRTNAKMSSRHTACACVPRTYHIAWGGVNEAPPPGHTSAERFGQPTMHAPLGLLGHALTRLNTSERARIAMHQIFFMAIAPVRPHLPTSCRVEGGARPGAAACKGMDAEVRTKQYRYTGRPFSSR